jgi:NTP pyrophosphatase (non-canonical NTP hydrolase)
METQKSVHSWCVATFPRYASKKGHALALLSEAVELALAAGLAAGLAFDTIRRAVEVPIIKHLNRLTEGEPLESDAGEVADVLVNVYAYAEEAGIDAQAELDKKMKENRQRLGDHYAAKTAQAEALGLVIEK